MPWQILRREAQLEILANSRMRKIEPGVAQTVIQGIILIFEFPGCDCRGNSLQRVFIESHHLAHFAVRTSSAIDDHVGAHLRSALSITPIDVLDHALALVATV